MRLDPKMFEKDWIKSSNRKRIRNRNIIILFCGLMFFSMMTTLIGTQQALVEQMQELSSETPINTETYLNEKSQVSKYQTKEDAKTTEQSPSVNRIENNFKGTSGQLTDKDKMQMVPAMMDMYSDLADYKQNNDSDEVKINITGNADDKYISNDDALSIEFHQATYSSMEDKYAFYATLKNISDRTSYTNIKVRIKYFNTTGEEYIIENEVVEGFDLLQDASASIFHKEKLPWKPVEYSVEFIEYTDSKIKVDKDAFVNNLIFENISITKNPNDEDEYLGTIKNNNDYGCAAFVTVKVTFFDKYEYEIGSTSKQIIDYYSLKPGEIQQFTVSTDLKLDPDHAKIEVLSLELIDVKNQQDKMSNLFTLDSQEVLGNGGMVYLFGGNITNNDENRSFEGIRLGVKIYDEDGNLLSKGSAGVSATKEPLKPNQTQSFKAYIPYVGEFDSYELFPLFYDEEYDNIN